MSCVTTSAPSRDSLACDLMEVCRPRGVDAFVLNWLQSEPLRKSDFWEDRNGNCRLISSLAIRLSETAETWRKLVAPVAEYVAQELWNSISRPASQQRFASRLTQAHRRAVKGSIVPAVNQPKPEHVCSDCGLKIPSGTKLCSNCAKQATRKNFRVGRNVAQRPEFLEKRSVTMQRHKRSIDNWKPSELQITRDAYVTQIQPALASVTKIQIRSALGISDNYTAQIKAGRIPHMRHWQTLARLAEINSRPVSGIALRFRIPDR
jgi:hypothetical protein